MQVSLNHVAILVHSLQKVIESDFFPTELIGEIESFPSEGTKEIYIGSTQQTARLLLMEPNGDGPYQNAMNKRGSGLHHIAIDVTDILEFTESLVGSGWLLHPKSLHFFAKNRQIYLARPNVPALIEVQERSTLSQNSPFIEKLYFPFGEKRLLKGLRCNNLSNAEEIKLFFLNKGINIQQLCKL